ncbi:metal-chelation protein CHAD [Corynebacterium sp. HMSC05H05]|uniref:CYTH and CHAD domain-containing protein n=1 Tax=Corynebacterium sp. HMSC05H05 TaxID=1581119 RepID=UPI0008A56493|nr:CYTH and CHAD domain-containing protein [Corynebacterium sp. HMSC05H05]OFT58768.1 metal-chelation protein CHAD [Corynebacterium sp. HMSC05H05]
MAAQAPEQFLEVEIKLAVDEGTGMPDLTQLPGVEEIASMREHNLSAVYYDTKDLRLTRSKITLRRRTGGADDGWHLKLPKEGGRNEVRMPLDDPSAVPEELIAQVRSIVRTEELAPVAQVDNRRVEILLSGADGEVAEFCDDHVTAWSLLPGGERTNWREWELELSEALAGTEEGETLINQGTSFLISAGARKSSSPSKLATALGDSAKTAPLPPHMQAELEADSPAAAVVDSLRKQRDAIVAWEPRVRADEYDSVHQLRVATREMRSLLETFEGILEGDELGALEDELKHAASVLGVARDAEVVEERFLELLDSDESGLVDDAARAHIAGDMRRDYNEAHAEIVAMLDSERFMALLDAIDGLLAEPPVAKQEASEEPPAESKEVLYDHLKRGYKKLKKRHDKVDEHYHDTDLPLHEREDYVHDVRKAAKKLRYSANAAADAGLKAGRLAKACKALQSKLGDFQDAVTSRDRIQRLAEEARERGEDTFAYGMLYQRELDRGEQALNGYDKAVREVRKAFKKIKP